MRQCMGKLRLKKLIETSAQLGTATPDVSDGRDLTI